MIVDYFVDSLKVAVNERDRFSGHVEPDWSISRKRADLPRSVLHSMRHIALSLIEKAGMPTGIVSWWADHYDIKFTSSQYMHASAKNLHERSTALGKLYKLN